MTIRIFEKGELREVPFAPIDWLIYMSWGSYLFSMVSALFKRIPFLASFSDVIVPICFITIIIISFRSICRKLFLIDYVFLFFCLFVYLSQYVIFPENVEWLNEYSNVYIFNVLPYYAIGVLVDIEKHFKSLFLISVLSVLMLSYNVLVYLPTVIMDNTGENMYFAYVLLPHLLMTLWGTFRTGNIISLIVSIIGAFSLLSMGNRGTLLCVVSFIVFYFVLFGRYKRKRVVRIVLVLSFLLLIAVSQFLMDYVYGIISDMGFSTRAFDMFYDGELTDSNGRDQITNRLMPLIWDKPVFGYGILGSNNYGINYAHNVVIDFLFSFGIVGGGVLLLVLLKVLIACYISSSSDIEVGFFLLLVSAGLVKLFLSDIYLNSPLFFMLIGYCVSLKRRAKRNKVIANETTLCSNCYVQF